MAMQSLNARGGPAGYQPIPAAEPRSDRTKAKRATALGGRESVVGVTRKNTVELDPEPANKAGLQSSLAYKPEDAMLSPWRFVESGWFQTLAAICTIGNVATVLSELEDASKGPAIFWLNIAFLFFYIFELAARILYFKGAFLSGPISLVAWNVLDIAIIGASLMDLWMDVSMPDASGPIVAVFKLSRVFRVARLLRVILEADLTWTEAESFQSFIGIVIGINALLMGLETDFTWEGWFYVEHILLGIYSFELLCSLKKSGLRFFAKDNPDMGWNVLDATIVCSSVVDSWLVPFFTLVVQCLQDHSKVAAKGDASTFGQAMVVMRMARLMRILRLVKLVKFVRPLLFMIVGVVAALQGVVWVLLLTVVSLYAAGIVTTRLIGHRMIFPPDMDLPDDMLSPWMTVPESMFTLFRVMSGSLSSRESVAIDELMKTLPSIKFAFVFFMITSSWTLLSILTAVVSENMISTTQQQYEEYKLTLFEEERVMQAESLCNLFGELDPSGKGVIFAADVENAMADEEFAKNAAVLLKMPKRDILDVLDMLIQQDVATDGVNVNQLVHCLMDSCAPVTERAMMKIESKLSELGRNLLHLEKVFQGDATVGSMTSMSLTTVEKTLRKQGESPSRQSGGDRNSRDSNQSGKLGHGSEPVAAADRRASTEVEAARADAAVVSDGAPRASPGASPAASPTASLEVVAGACSPRASSAVHGLIQQDGSQPSVLERQHHEDVLQAVSIALDSKLNALQNHVIRNLEIVQEGMSESRGFSSAVQQLQDQLVERFCVLERQHQDSFRTLLSTLDRTQETLRDVRGKKSQWGCPMPLSNSSQVLRDTFPRFLPNGALQDEFEVTYHEDRSTLTRQNAKDLCCSRV